MSYAVLVLPNTDRMTLPVLRKIHDLVADGATIAGPKPVSTPGLTGYPASLKEFNELVFDLWGDLDGVSRTRRTSGKGRVFCGVPLSYVLASLGIEKDADFNSTSSKVAWIHRRTDNADMYFVVNRTDTLLDLSMTLRTAGREAELWDPADGSINPSSYILKGNKTVVPLSLKAKESVFVVFRNKTDIKSRNIVKGNDVTLATLGGPWTVSFNKDLGAPEKAEFPQLESWTLNSDEGIKYYSGTASYVKSFTAPKSWFSDNNKILIDLGRVCDLAEVFVNGKPAGMVWTDAFRADLTGMLVKGSNTLEIRVTNEWTNRLAGDQKAQPGKKILNSPIFSYSRGLNESGLIGPVTIIKE